MTVKKIICLILLILLSLLVTGAGGIYLNSTSAGDEPEPFPGEGIIRFHVVANSNEDRDQEVKMMVTEEVLDYVEYMLVDTESAEEARQILTEEMGSIKGLVENILEREGTPHPVEIKLENHMFPDREYVYGYFPAGEYESLRIIIGDGAGENWWCVLFPPLCFSHRPGTGEGDNKGEENSTVSKIVLEEDKMEVRFRIVEWANRIFPAYYRAEQKDK
ncbi:MAG: stage II sporulation protein R [Firmicutes bacterium HGW-Firmicutes-13]|nr:MAG: stage II sporulation protein R [Firmicutes bacterium HGW-Firmicutes-13]